MYKKQNQINQEKEFLPSVFLNHAEDDIPRNENELLGPLNGLDLTKPPKFPAAEKDQPVGNGVLLEDELYDDGVVKELNVEVGEPRATFEDEKKKNYSELREPHEPTKLTLEFAPLLQNQSPTRGLPGREVPRLKKKPVEVDLLEEFPEEESNLHGGQALHYGDAHATREVVLLENLATLEQKN